MAIRKFDVIVVGGGLLGCFAARSLTKYALSVALLEKREDLCTGISRANTAIVYSGCDTKPGTMKTSMCVKSARGFAALCAELGVRYSACGSIMVCFGERGAAVLRKKLRQGASQGVRGMRMLTREEVLELEPNIAGNVDSGLFVPDTGTVMPWELCLAAAESAAGNGAEIVLNAEVTGIAKAGGAGGAGGTGGVGGADSTLCPGHGYVVRTGAGEFFARAVVNCAGLSAENVLEMVSAPVVRVAPTFGDYYVLDTKAAGHIRHIIFHEREDKGKGLTLVPTVDGNILVGPTERKGADEPYATTGEGLEQLRSLVAEVMPSLPLERVINSFGAVRPNPYMLAKGDSGGWAAEERSISDFCVVESDGGAFLSFVGIKTPGLTCACELGGYAADKVAALFGAGPNAGYDPARPFPARPAGLALRERDALIRGNPGYGEIVCRCREVSEGEVIDAIRRAPGAVTLDGVRRRTGAGSGRCQGGYCAKRVVEILARELGCVPEGVTKSGEGSNILMGRRGGRE